MDWSRGLWDHLVTTDVMEDAWLGAMSIVGMAENQDPAIKGAPGATVQAVRRLGWTFPAYDTVITEDGTALKMDKISVATLKRFAERAIHESKATTSSWVAVLGGVPDFAPLRSICASSKGLASTATASLRALGEGGWWTQADIFAVKRSSTKMCKLCGTSVGTFKHRVVGCSERRDIYDAYRNQDIIQAAGAASRDANT